MISAGWVNGLIWPAPLSVSTLTLGNVVASNSTMARFGAQFVGLPYQMALDPVCRRQYALGWYRPGDFAPKKIYQVPLNGRAAATAAGVYAGLFWLVP